MHMPWVDELIHVYHDVYLYVCLYVRVRATFRVQIFIYSGVKTLNHSFKTWSYANPKILYATRCVGFRSRSVRN